MDKLNVEGVILTPLKRIQNPKGDLFHAMKKSDPGFDGFGEAYFSTINFEETKIWKKHLEMTLNLVVPLGMIRFVIYDDRNGSVTENNFFDVTLGDHNYQRITVPPGVWVAFRGLNSDINLLLNLANMEHDPVEVDRKEKLSDILYPW